MEKTDTFNLIKEKITQLIDNESLIPRTRYMMMEKLIYVMLGDYLRKQKKTLFVNDLSIGCDFFVEDGFDNYDGRIALDLKWGQVLSRGMIYDTIGRMMERNITIDSLIIITIGSLSSKAKERICKDSEIMSFKIHIWDINDLVDLFCKNTELFFEAYDNINKSYIDQTISKGINRNKNRYIKQRNDYINELRNVYNNDDLVLFLGAGISKDANIATWDNLISTLFVSLVNKKLKEEGIDIDDESRNELVERMRKQNNYSPLLQTRFLRQGIDDFEGSVREALYSGASNTSDTLKSIANLCAPKRGKVGIKAIVTYNFDDLIEKNLKNINLNYKSIYNDGIIPNSDEIGIYHVHGFLPQSKAGYGDLTKSLLVFSEEGYHKLMLEPYNWANLTQLNFLMNNTCLFVGLSMTDPNMRRLLDIACQKSIENGCKHYVILKRFNISKDDEDNIMKFEQINEELQESFYKELGVNVIWVDEYREIPSIIKSIKN